MWWSAFRYALSFCWQIRSSQMLGWCSLTWWMSSARYVMLHRGLRFGATQMQMHIERHMSICACPKYWDPSCVSRCSCGTLYKWVDTVFVYIFINHGHEVRWWLHTVEVWVNPEHQWHTSSLDKKTADAQSLWTSVFGIFNLCGDWFKCHCLDLSCHVLMILEETKWLVIGIPPLSCSCDSHA